MKNKSFGTIKSFLKQSPINFVSDEVVSDN